MARTLQDLMVLQGLPLDVKIQMSCSRIQQWVTEWGADGVYVAFSGGKDSTVLLDLVRNRCGYKGVKAMFVDVPTQYPELKQFVKTFDDVDIVKPKMNFMQVCEKYGFPLISKEVSEAVHGAKQYYEQLKAEGKLPTDLIGNGGGYKHYHHYKRVAGIGEYAKRENGKQGGRSESAVGSSSGMVSSGEREAASDKGDYP